MGPSWHLPDRTSARIASCGRRWRSSLWMDVCPVARDRGDDGAVIRSAELSPSHAGRARRRPGDSGRAGATRGCGSASCIVAVSRRGRRPACSRRPTTPSRSGRRPRDAGRGRSASTADDLVAQRVRFADADDLDRLLQRRRRAARRPRADPGRRRGRAAAAGGGRRGRTTTGLVEVPVAVEPELVPPVGRHAGSVVDVYAVARRRRQATQPPPDGPVLPGPPSSTRPSVDDGVRRQRQAPARPRRSPTTDAAAFFAACGARRRPRSPWSAGAEPAERGRRPDPRVRCGLGDRGAAACSSASRRDRRAQALRRRRRPARHGDRRPGRRRGGRARGARASTWPRSTTCARHGVRPVAVAAPAPADGAGCGPAGSASRPSSPTTTSTRCPTRSAADEQADADTVVAATRWPTSRHRRRGRRPGGRRLGAGRRARAGRRSPPRWPPSSAARAPYDPGRRRPLRRRGGPAARHPRRGLRPARRRPGWPRGGMLEERFGSVQRALDEHLTRGHRAAAARPLGRGPARHRRAPARGRGRARRRRGRHRLQPRGRPAGEFGRGRRATR